ncbi:uncharacterized protein LOC133909324 [Phragmites australis]|uniref:uncharacterized protein LOC133909324 n=1 Tax=Phragmites australis TaxID=29695 RepID=UPI002D795E64|nr:uncharacterized protein LOC133909324 [Phragmites australis]
MRVREKAMPCRSARSRAAAAKMAVTAAAFFARRPCRPCARLGLGVGAQCRTGRRGLRTKPSAGVLRQNRRKFGVLSSLRKNSLECRRFYVRNLSAIHCSSRGYLDSVLISGTSKGFPQKVMHACGDPRPSGATRVSARKPELIQLTCTINLIVSSTHPYLSTTSPHVAPARSHPYFLGRPTAADSHVSRRHRRSQRGRVARRAARRLPETERPPTPALASLPGAWAPR